MRIEHGGAAQTRAVKSGSSYLSQSELPLTFGVGRRDAIERAVVTWPGGRIEEYKSLRAGRAYDCVEGAGISPVGY